MYFVGGVETVELIYTLFVRRNYSFVDLNKDLMVSFS